MGSPAGTSTTTSQHRPVGVLAAVAAGQVQLRYDVLSDVGTGRLVGLQTDLVWEHPARGPLSADEVWAAAEPEEHRPLRRWLLQQACSDAAELSDTVHVGVQLPAGLTAPGTFVDDVTDALTASGLAADRLALTFPEELLHRASGALLAGLTALHGSGVRLALTDYGLGTTLWGLLTRVPLDAVVVSLRTLRTTGGLDHALRVLRGISEAAAQVKVRTIIADVDSPTLLARVGSMGSLAMTGPLLPTGLTAAQAAGLLRPRPTLV
jgi:EAL domain-containing protein (putative c-di-GMP-specific phosphodiesterase class I)